VIEQVCTDLGESFEEIDIDAHERLRARFTDEVPVTFVDGTQHDFFRVDPVRLRIALGGEPNHS
jgi:dienelactone hydrolase